MAVKSDNPRPFRSVYCNAKDWAVIVQHASEIDERSLSAWIVRTCLKEIKRVQNKGSKTVE